MISSLMVQGASNLPMVTNTVKSAVIKSTPAIYHAVKGVARAMGSMAELSKIPVRKAPILSHYQQQQEWVAALTPAEKIAIFDYSKTDYGDINKYLRTKNKQFKEKESLLKNKIDLISSALSKSKLVEDMYVYRTTTKDAFDNCGVSKLEDLKGLVLLERGFLSTSDEKVGFSYNPTRSDIYLKIKLPKGTNAGSIGPLSFYQCEGEILVAEDQKLLVTDVRKSESIKKNGQRKTVIECELLLNPNKKNKNVYNNQTPEFSPDNLDELQNMGAIRLGGTGTMKLYKDTSGQEYLFKPSQDKAGRCKPFKANILECSSNLQKRIDIDSYVPVKTITLDGEFGSIQPKIPHSVSSLEIAKLQTNKISEISPNLLKQFQREHVIDVLLANYDSHGRNFIVDENGVLRGLDKEQAFKYINEVRAQSLSCDYHPNSQYGELEPIYNTIYKAYGKGLIKDLDWNETFKFIDIVEKIPEQEYKDIFRPYVDSLHPNDSKENQTLLEKILDRKKNLRKYFEDFKLKLG